MKLDPSFAPVYGAIIAATGLLIAAYMTHRFQERTRMLDLYKVAYPKKVEAASALWDKSSRLMWQSVRLTSLAKTATLDEFQEVWDSVDNQREEMWSLIKYYHSLLGDDVYNGIREFMADCSAIARIASEVQQGKQRLDDKETAQLRNSYDKLTSALRKSIHIDKLEKVIGEK